MSFLRHLAGGKVLSIEQDGLDHGVVEEEANFGNLVGIYLEDAAAGLSLGVVDFSVRRLSRRSKECGDLISVADDGINFDVRFGDTRRNASNQHLFHNLAARVVASENGATLDPHFHVFREERVRIFPAASARGGVAASDELAH